jgi:hypothetical protein
MSEDPLDYSYHSNAQAVRWSDLMYALRALAASYGAKAVITMIGGDEFTCDFKWPDKADPQQQADCATKAEAIISRAGGEVC